MHVSEKLKYAHPHVYHLMSDLIINFTQQADNFRVFNFSVMDTRITLNNKESFFQILKELYTGQSKASMLYDDRGLTRYEGLILGINEGTGQPSLQLQGGLEIPVSSVVAVNGIFSPDYCEC